MITIYQNRMTREEYWSGCARINKERNESLVELAKKFALENNPYKKGDIIQDHIGRGRILGYKLYYGINSLPSLVYRCENLTKKGEVNKKEPVREIYQNNILK